MFVVVMAFISCNKDDDNDPLVGTWAVSYTEYGTLYSDEITFNSDNSGNVSYYEDGDFSESFPFTWSANNNILTVSLLGETDSLPYSISGNKLTLDGEVYTRK